MGNDDEQMVSQASIKRFLEESERFLKSWDPASHPEDFDPDALAEYFRLLQHLSTAGKHLMLAAVIATDHPQLLERATAKATTSCSMCHCTGRGWIPGDELMPGKGDAGQVFPCYCSCHDR
jgi:hypothetical protein